MARTVRRVSRGTPARRKLVWARLYQTTQILAGNHLVVDLLDQFELEYGASSLGVTVMRTRVRYAPMIRSSASPSRTFPVLALGIREVTRSTLGTYAVTDPVGPGNDLHADWMAYDTVSVMSTPIAATADFEASPDRYLDVKSMRKISELGSTLALYVDHDSTEPVDLTLTTSVLLALP